MPSDAPPFPDQVVEARVAAVIAQDGRLPRWGWKTPGPYNGATGAERIAGWQKIQIACRRGWMAWPDACSVCERVGSLHHHAENYFRPLAVKPICRSCHYRVHRRFREPEVWTDFIAVRGGGWISHIAAGELSRFEGLRQAETFDPFLWSLSLRQ